MSSFKKPPLQKKITFEVLPDPDENDKTDYEKDSEDPSADCEVFVMYKRRWIMFIIFALQTIINAVMWITFAPIQLSTITFYGIDKNRVNWLALAYQVLYLPGTAMASYSISRFGFKNGLVHGCILNTLGAWLRWLSTKSDSEERFGEYSYVCLMIGQSLAGLAQPYFTNTPAKFAGEWFSLSQRDVATTLCAMLNPVGIAVGQVLPPLLVNSDTGYGMATLLLGQACVATGILGITFLLFQEAPPTPPSRTTSMRHLEAVGEQKREAQRAQLWKDVRWLLTNKNFILLLMTFGIGLGIFNAVTALLAQLIQPCYPGAQENQDYSSYFGASIIGFGLVACAVVGPLMDYTHKYNPILKVCFVLALLASTFCLSVLRANNFPWLLAGFGVMGSCMMPILPATLECGIECTYPIPEETSGGMLMMAGQYCGVFLTLLYGYLITVDKTCTTVFTPVALAIVISVCVCVLVIMFYQGPYRRLNEDKGTHTGLNDDLSVPFCFDGSGEAHVPMGRSNSISTNGEASS